MNLDNSDVLYFKLIRHSITFHEFRIVVVDPPSFQGFEISHHGFYTGLDYADSHNINTFLWKPNNAMD